MQTGKVKTAASISACSILFGLSIMPINQYAYGLSAEVLCQRPNFILWKKQQEKRLWSPSKEAQMAERSGKVFTYNCFTIGEIDKFFSIHEERIENANFILILEPERLDNEEDDDACD